MLRILVTFAGRHQTDVRRLFSGIRDAWLIFGIALVVFFALEGGYRLTQRATPRPKPLPADHPYHGQAWVAGMQAALAATKRAFAFDPYRGYWAVPMTSPYVNVDSLGRRLTVQPAVPSAAPEVWLIGGSAMWGAAVRDSFTVPSQLAAALARRGVSGVRIVNLAQPGFNSFQESATLQLALAHGGRPAAVVLFNGFNDINTAVLTGRIGSTYAQDIAQQYIDFGKRGFWGEMLGAGRHSMLVRALLRAATPAPPPARFAADSVCPPAAAFYSTVERNLLAIAREQGFPLLIFLQPHAATTHKRLTSYETRIRRDPRVAACFSAFAAAMSPQAGHTFFDLRPLFDADTVTVFVDSESHVTETSTARIADAIADRLIPALARARAD